MAMWRMSSRQTSGLYSCSISDPVFLGLSASLLYTSFKGASIMANTIIGVFDDYANAQNALSALLQTGLARSNITLTPSDESYSSRQSVLRRGASDEDETEGWNIGHFFRSLFGTGDNVNKHTDIYSEAIRRGSYLLSVDVDSQEQHDRTLEVLNRNQPFDIDDRAEQWKTQGWSGYDSNAPILSDEEIARERATYGTYGTSATKNPLSTSADAAANTYSTQTPAGQEDLSTGRRDSNARVFQRVSERPTYKQSSWQDESVNPEAVSFHTGLSAADDADFREHWKNSYAHLGGRYEDYAPAYQYGSRLAGNPVYKNSRWNDIESQVKQEWESNNRSTSTWENAKEAVRAGWEKLTR